MVKLSDIAEEAGCSVTVVSRVLHPGGAVRHRIAEATRERVLSAASRLRYHPNRSAEFLKRGVLPEIGLCTTDAANNLVLDLVRGASAEAEREGFYVSFRYSLMPVGGVEFLREAARRHLCGIIIYPDFLLREEEQALLREYQAGGGEVVVLDVGNERHPEWDLPTVTIDDEQGGRLAARHLLACGAEHFFYQGVERRRQDGFLAELASAGRTARVFQHDEEEKAVAVCLAQQGAVGLFCSNDWLALQVHSLLLRAGEVPGKRIRLIGYDDLYGSAAVSPALTTVRQPFNAAGEAAVKMLIDRLYGRPLANCRLTPEVEVRET